MSQMQRFSKGVLGDVQSWAIELCLWLGWSLIWFLIGAALGGLKTAVLIGVFCGVFGYFPFGRAITGWFRKHWRDAKEQKRR